MATLRRSSSYVERIEFSEGDGSVFLDLGVDFTMDHTLEIPLFVLVIIPKYTMDRHLLL